MSLIATKLAVPPLRTHRIVRPRLTALLNQATATPLTLISAAAGFGKTTLITSWASESSKPLAWITLDKEDNDPIRFLSYLIAALQTLDPQIGSELSSVLQLPQTPIASVILPTLLNDLHAHISEKNLVLDDYHVIGNKNIHELLTFLIEQQPASL